MQRYLITGAGGFVARHFLDLLESSTEACEVMGVDRKLDDEPRSYRFPYTTIEIDLLDKKILDALLVGFQPTRILHLASVSSVGISWKDPVSSVLNNTNIFLNIVDCVRTRALRCRILSVGSSEEYGTFDAKALPLLETQELHPASPYGAARVAQEHLSKIFTAGYALDIVMTRSFNHIGPGQRDQFVVSSFAKQISWAATGGSRTCEIAAGNISVIRDFLDVRDVVRAYHMLFESGVAGEVYNVCSGHGISLASLIEKMAIIQGINVNVSMDRNLLRPNELPAIYGSAEKLRLATGWSPRIALEKSLSDVLAHWRSQPRNSADIGK